VTDATPVTGEKPGFLVTFEGPEGSGKSTVIRAVAALLKAAGCDPLQIREPGGTEIGERIRNILLDEASEGMSGETELLLMVASRAQLVREKIKPALAAGKLILCDRFADASVAYQGFGRELGTEAVHDLNRVALGGVVPDLTFLCMLPPEVGQSRLQNRATDRLDHESSEFHAKVFKGYEAMAVSSDRRFQVIDAGASPEHMLAEVMQNLKKRFAHTEHELLKNLLKNLE
jgi:dTMP kinase